MREEAATHRLGITEKLRLLKNEFHALNVQLIREGLPAALPFLRIYGFIGEPNRR